MCGLFWEGFTWRLFVLYIIFFSSFLRLTCFHSKVITSTFQRQADVTPANIKIAFYRRYNTTTIITKYVITKNVIMILLHRWKQYQEKPIQNLIRYKDTTHEYPTICRFWNLTHQKRRQHLRLPPIDLILCALLFTRSNLHADMRLELLQDLKNFRNEFLNIQAEANHSDCI